MKGFFESVWKEEREEGAPLTFAWPEITETSYPTTSNLFKKHFGAQPSSGQEQEVVRAQCGVVHREGLAAALELIKWHVA